MCVRVGAGPRLPGFRRAPAAGGWASVEGRAGGRQPASFGRSVPVDSTQGGPQGVILPPGCAVAAGVLGGRGKSKALGSDRPGLPSGPFR